MNAIAIILSPSPLFIIFLISSIICGKTYDEITKKRKRKMRWEKTTRRIIKK